MPKMKPILFNTEMVKAILDGRKTVTRRGIKPQPKSRLVYICMGYKHKTWGYPGKDTCKYGEDESFRLPEDLNEEELNKHWNPPYHTDDILYVRETWNTTDDCGLFPPWPSTGTHYMYLADAPDSPEAKEARWRPSIHMPKEAARIFLRVTDVRVERLQEITERGIFQSANGRPSPRVP